MRHALIDDQLGSGRGHRLAQQRLLTRQPGLQVAQGPHFAGQGNFGKVRRRRLAELAQKHQADHLTTRHGHMPGQRWRSTPDRKPEIVGLGLGRHRAIHRGMEQPVVGARAQRLAQVHRAFLTQTHI